jgi:hypothetical protein
VPARGRAESFLGVECAAWQGPCVRERRLAAPPEQYIQPLLADLEHDAERLVAEAVGRHTVIVTAIIAGRPRTAMNGPVSRPA